MTSSARRSNTKADRGQNAREENPVDLFRFTSRINRALDEKQKAEFIGMLWQIVHADNDRNELEDHLVGYIAELIGVSGRDRINQRLEVENRGKH